jgi:hypothetical protein
MLFRPQDGQRSKTEGEEGLGCEYPPDKVPITGLPFSLLVKIDIDPQNLPRKGWSLSFMSQAK